MSDLASLPPPLEEPSPPSTPSNSSPSTIPKTEVEVFHFRAVPCSPARPSREVGAQVKEAMLGSTFQHDIKDDLGFHENAVEDELAHLDALSDKSSLCDCPAHVHDRETPLEIDKVGMYRVINWNLGLSFCSKST